MRRKQKIFLPRSVGEGKKPFLLTPSHGTPGAPARGVGRRNVFAVRTSKGKPSSIGRNKHEPGVYIVQVEGQSLMKIGTASDLARRIEALECSSPHRLMCRAWIPAPSKAAAHKVEKAVHATLKKAGRHVKLEWFTIGDHEVSWVEGYAKGLIEKIPQAA